MAEMTATVTVMGTNMTLRDWFAGQALAGLCACPEATMGSTAKAEWAYEHADAMMAERSKAEQTDPWRDLTDDEAGQVAIHSRDLGFLCGPGGARKVWDAIRKVRGGE